MDIKLDAGNNPQAQKPTPGYRRTVNQTSFEVWWRDATWQHAFMHGILIPLPEPWHAIVTWCRVGSGGRERPETWAERVLFEQPHSNDA